MDVERFRRETPGTRHCVHLNNAGAALMPDAVLSAVHGHLELESRIGGYEAADEAREEIEAAYEAVGRIVGAPASTIAFTENATAAFVQALSAVRFSPGDVLLTSRNDYVSNQITYLSLQDRLGIEVLRAPDLPEGGVDPVAVEEIVHRRRPRLVAMSHVPTSSGLVQDLQPVGEACRARDIPFLVDACQSVGQIPVDVEALGCDFLSATARKFLRGPRGVGFLHVSQRVLDAGLEPLFPDLRGADWIAEDLYQPAPDARRFENWEFPWALVLGLGAAAAYADAVGVEAIEERVVALAARARLALGALDGVRVVDRGPRLCGIVAVAIEGRDPATVVRALRERGVNTSSIDRGSALLEFDAQGIEGALRVSPHYFNTETELDALVDALREILRTPVSAGGAA